MTSGHETHTHGTPARVFLKKGRDRSLRRFHPWIFSGAVERIEGDAGPGAFAEVFSHDGERLGLGQLSPASQIMVRMLAFGEDPVFSCQASVADAIEARKTLPGLCDTDALRLVNAESDGLPGVVIDRYGDYAVCQFNTAGAEVLKNEIVAALLDSIDLKGIYERSDTDGRRREGLEPVSRKLVGEDIPELLEIHENGARYLVDVRNGHKTGFYLDQRDNREIVGSMAAGKETLNVFSYTGGFGVSALARGAASVTNIDISESALGLARKNAELNGFGGGACEYIAGNAFEVLRKFRDSRRSFDLIVLDPPKFAETKGGILGAARGYKDINLLAMKLLRPGGILATFSCSGAMTPELFGKVVAEAAADARCDLTAMRHLRQAGDHPETVFFPEGAYLKGLLLWKRR